YLDDVPYDTRREVVESLGNIGTGNQTAIAALVQLLSSPSLDYSTRSELVENLKKNPDKQAVCRHQSLKSQLQHLSGNS
ncbi:MAG TPA: HEAT repeat domain-containing protein, partial [Phormidium sp.]